MEYIGHLSSTRRTIIQDMNVHHLVEIFSVESQQTSWNQQNFCHIRQLLVFDHVKWLFLPSKLSSIPQSLRPVGSYFLMADKLGQGRPPIEQIETPKNSKFIVNFLPNLCPVSVHVPHVCRLGREGDGYRLFSIDFYFHF